MVQGPAKKVNNCSQGARKNAGLSAVVVKPALDIHLKCRGGKDRELQTNRLCLEGQEEVVARLMTPISISHILTPTITTINLLSKSGSKSPWP